MPSLLLTGDIRSVINSLTYKLKCNPVFRISTEPTHIKNMGYYTNEIIRNAEKINLLKNRIDESVKLRDKNKFKRTEWEKACADFHSQYNSLAFPGGFKGAYERILSGNKKTIEAALCFIECRPYFFRSGYMFKDIMKKLKRAPLDPKEKVRFEKVLIAYNEYKKQKNA